MSEKLEYIEDMRAYFGLNTNDTSMDEEIKAMEPMKRVRILSSWFHDSEEWADIFKKYFESQGFILTTK